MLSGRARTVWIGAALAALAGCSAAPPASLTDPAPDELAGWLSVAESASARLANHPADQAAARILAFAVRELEAGGVAPAEGQPDLITRWRQQAETAGASRPGPPLRGRVLGPLYRRGVVAPHVEARSEQAFHGGQLARVTLAPAQPGISLHVHGTADARLVTCRQRQVHECAWLPLFTERYRLVVRNSGNRSVTYFLTMD